MAPLHGALVFALMLSACSGSAQLKPATHSASLNDQRPAAELIVLGREAAARGDVVRAEQYLGLAIEQGADRREVMPLLLRACLQSSHLRAALNHAEPYLLEYPDDDNLRYLVANIHLGLGQVVAARRELGLLLQKNPRNPDAHYLLGIIESNVNIEAARDHFLSTLRFSNDQKQRIEVQSRLDELRLRERELARAGGNEP